ncbi:hypothetical protein AAFC00_006358 [Neodothiora populina]|uniref:Snorna binding protein n=1 Tax=Neodothiora populina TaxID=2781224 RepID=A0ABR3P596_9PEZI
MVDGGRARALCSLLRNLFLAGALYAVIFSTIKLAHDPSARAKAKDAVPAFLNTPQHVEPEVVKQTKSGLKVKLSSSSTKTVTINPYANVFNRPISAVLPKDDFYGPRPHVDTEANLPMLVEECRGSYEGIEKMHNVFDCLAFLANDENRYYTLPQPEHRASEQDPRHAEYQNADGHGNTLEKYPSIDHAEPVSETSLGTCPGPIIPYHVYWSGPATWRVEVFIKAYLYTQNLACSRLWLWLDADRSPTAVEDMLANDTLFARFLPFVERGDIKLMSWRFPSRMPLPSAFDNTDGFGYYKNPGPPNSKGDTVVADGIIEDRSGQQWATLTPKQMTFFPQAISDAVRFVILHLHGGVYMDMDVLMLRDMRPLLLPKVHDFAERWAAHSHPGDYNTAIMSLTANSSLSSYLLRGGIRMGLNFHPRVIGRMAWKDGRDQEFLMLETAAFDPIWTEFNWDREGRCTVPCIRDYSAVFKGKPGAVKDEWESFDGPELPLLNASLAIAPEHPESTHASAAHVQRDALSVNEAESIPGKQEKKTDRVIVSTMAEPLASFTTSDEEAEALEKSGVVKEYRIEEDKYPPNNRTLENFFRGAWTYHVHNQWLKHPEPSSWLDVMQSAHDGFLAGKRVNVYGETWKGPKVARYNEWADAGF